MEVDCQGKAVKTVQISFIWLLAYTVTSCSQSQTNALRARLSFIVTEVLTVSVRF